MIIAVVEDRTLSILAGTFAATIAANDIEHNFHALTHFPERRTLSELEGLAERLNNVAAYRSSFGRKQICPCQTPSLRPSLAVTLT